MKELFLDANAHMPMNKAATDALIQFNNSLAGHGHALALSAPSRAANNVLEKAREDIAEMIGAESSNQIIFTSGCTQACQWGMEIFFNQLFEELDRGNYYELKCSAFEHPAIKQAFEEICKKHYHNYIPYSEPNKDGEIIFTSHSRLTRSNFMICTHMQNEIGLIYDIANIDCKYIFSDMSQSLGKIPVNVTELDVDIAVFGAHKFGGPSGFGFMYLKDTDWWKPYGTGSRYFFDRAGTPDVAGAVSAAAALSYALKTLPERTSNCIEFRNVLEPFLESIGIEIICKNSNRSPNTTFAHVPGRGAELITELGKQGIYIGLGSACGSVYAGPSQTVTSLCRDGNADDYIRISQFGEYGLDEAKCFIDIFEKIYGEKT